MKKVSFVLITALLSIPSLGHASFLKKSSFGPYVRHELRPFDGSEKTKHLYNAYKESHDHYLTMDNLLAKAASYLNAAEYAEHPGTIALAKTRHAYAYELYKKSVETCRQKESAYIIAHLEDALPQLDTMLTKAKTLEKTSVQEIELMRK